jgi:hypothetical protein
MAGRRCAGVIFTPNRGDFSEVVFDHWFVEVKGAGKEPMLLSHWVPDSVSKADFTRPPRHYDLIHVDPVPSTTPGGIIITLAWGWGGIGDDRDVDLMSFDTRLHYFTDNTARTKYNTSEGYARESEKVEFSLFPEKIIVRNRYLAPGR